VNREKR